MIAGERRWQAAQDSPKSRFLVLEVGEKEALELAIVENVQRIDLNALEEAAGYAQLGGCAILQHMDNLAPPPKSSCCLRFPNQ